MKLFGCDGESGGGLFLLDVDVGVIIGDVGAELLKKCGMGTVR